MIRRQISGREVQRVVRYRLAVPYGTPVLDHDTMLSFGGDHLDRALIELDLELGDGDVTPMTTVGELKRKVRWEHEQHNDHKGPGRLQSQRR